MGVELDSLGGISQRMTQMGVIDNLSHPFHFMLESTFITPPPHYDLFKLYIVLLNFEILN